MDPVKYLKHFVFANKASDQDSVRLYVLSSH